MDIKKVASGVGYGIAAIATGWIALAAACGSVPILIVDKIEEKITGKSKKSKKDSSHSEEDEK